ncbi:unnamed protein product [Heligmosomoides polygyrus]|uniref:Uncharacterized protein n=1 Tax=Heligmosomoides polygyrus TaxID=6339 RepID=A0A183G1P3_HELPZ|nr:unnamed protein product [Heligmosomoides polygyrus]
MFGCRVLLERPMGITEVLVGPRKNYGLKNVSVVHIFIDFLSFIHENQRGPARGMIPPQTMAGCGFSRCPTIAEVLGASVDHILPFL